MSKIPHLLQNDIFLNIKYNYLKGFFSVVHSQNSNTRKNSFFGYIIKPLSDFNIHLFFHDRYVFYLIYILTIVTNNGKNSIF